MTSSSGRPRVLRISIGVIVFLLLRWLFAEKQRKPDRAAQAGAVGQPLTDSALEAFITRLTTLETKRVRARALGAFVVLLPVATIAVLVLPQRPAAPASLETTAAALNHIGWSKIHDTES